MTITQTVDIPADYRLRLDVEVPRNIPTGKTSVIIQFPNQHKTSPVPMIKDAYGIFKDLKGMDTTIERDDEDRI